MLLRKIILHTTKWLPCNSSKKCGSSLIMKCDYNRSWRKIFRIFFISASKNKKVFTEGWKSKYTCTCRSAACLTATPLLQSPCYYSHFNYYSDSSKSSVSPNSLFIEPLRLKMANTGRLLWPVSWQTYGVPLNIIFTHLIFPVDFLHCIKRKTTCSLNFQGLVLE